MIDLFKDILKAFSNAFLTFAAAFSVGTAGGAAVCLYYGIPLGFSVIGGILVLGIALALMSESSIF